MALVGRYLLVWCQIKKSLEKVSLQPHPHLARALFDILSLVRLVLYGKIDTQSSKEATTMTIVIFRSPLLTAVIFNPVTLNSIRLNSTHQFDSIQTLKPKIK